MTSWRQPEKPEWRVHDLTSCSRNTAVLIHGGGGATILAESSSDQTDLFKSEPWSLQLGFRTDSGSGVAKVGPAGRLGPLAWLWPQASAQVDTDLFLQLGCLMYIKTFYFYLGQNYHRQSKIFYDRKYLRQHQLFLDNQVFVFSSSIQWLLPWRKLFCTQICFRFIWLNPAAP